MLGGICVAAQGMIIPLDSFEHSVLSLNIYSVCVKHAEYLSCSLVKYLFITYKIGPRKSKYNESHESIYEIEFEPTLRPTQRMCCIGLILCNLICFILLNPIGRPNSGFDGVLTEKNILIRVHPQRVNYLGSI